MMPVSPTIFDSRAGGLVSSWKPHTRRAVGTPNPKYQAHRDMASDDVGIEDDWEDDEDATDVADAAPDVVAEAASPAAPGAVPDCWAACCCCCCSTRVARSFRAARNVARSSALIIRVPLPLLLLNRAGRDAAPDEGRWWGADAGRGRTHEDGSSAKRRRVAAVDATRPAALPPAIVLRLEARESILFAVAVFLCGPLGQYALQLLVTPSPSRQTCARWEHLALGFASCRLIDVSDRLRPDGTPYGTPHSSRRVRVIVKGKCSSDSEVETRRMCREWLGRVRLGGSVGATYEYG
jgi:hypothetical protein